VESPLALYRRYRPETFAEVIGQDHVTEPLRVALANNRVNHAYLFSGPRGCGKTTSARILARALNCVQAPVADPCGECESCRDLARGGPGSIDVIEIDAAVARGSTTRRDLREKAFFADGAQQVQRSTSSTRPTWSHTQGFNALLKLVEEPPPHLRFIFATTEPDKVLPTIRSRTHHYPFRLIPPRLLSSYLSDLCAREGVAIDPAALPLVVRAGGGSARDTLSVLDQLLGGAGPAGVTHELAAGLLGYTPDTLLDEVVDAFAAGDGAAVFGVVDKVVETGQDPRRFTEDLLRRLRDLVIVAAVPDAPATGLIDVSEDQGERLVAQAARFGAAELSRAADIAASGLTEMRGATAPRLLLELLCARILLPGADHATDGVLARLDRLEKRLTISAPHAGRERTRRTAPPRPAAPPPARPAAPDPAGRADPNRPPARRRASTGGRAGSRDGPARAGGPRVAAAACARARRRGRAAAAGSHTDPGAGRGRRTDAGRRTPPLARHRRRHQAAPTPGVDAPHAELPGRRGRRQHAHAGVHQRRRARLVRQRWLRRGAPAGRDRCRRGRLAHRDDHRPRRPRRRAGGDRPGRPGRGAARAAGRAQRPRAARAAVRRPRSPDARAPDPESIAAARDAIPATRRRPTRPRPSGPDWAARTPTPTRRPSTPTSRA